MGGGGGNSKSKHSHHSELNVPSLYWPYVWLQNMQLHIIYSLQYNISINITVEVDPPPDSLHNGIVKFKNLLHLKLEILCILSDPL